MLPTVKIIWIGSSTNMFTVPHCLRMLLIIHSAPLRTDQTIVLSIKLTQSNVDSEFRMPVPLYMEMADGRILWVGRVRMHGNTTVATEIPLTGLKEKPKRAIINYMNDVLAAN